MERSKCCNAFVDYYATCDAHGCTRVNCNHKQITEKKCNMCKRIIGKDVVMDGVDTYKFIEKILDVHAQVIDDLYMQYKEGFCDGKPHSLGYFKEKVKSEFYQQLTTKLCNNTNTKS